MPRLFITGASRGLGLAFVRTYLAQNWDVIATCRTPDQAIALQQLATEYPALLRIEKLDVTQDAAITALADTLKDVPLDLLINNAGIVSGSSTYAYRTPAGDSSQSFGTLDRTAWLQVFSTNTIAPLKVAEAFTPALRRGQGRKIVMISSVMGSIERSDPDHFAYCSSKAALNAAMHALATSLHPDGISVISLHPGWVRTDMGGPDGLLEPEESAAKLVRVIDGVTQHDSGHFFSYDGKTIAW